MKKKRILALINLTLLFLFCFLFFNQELQADTPRTIPPQPCDFYGIEVSPGAINAGSIITAKDPQGIIVGQWTVEASGQYGFLTARPDDPNTPEDEGAVSADIITFYIDGVKQQKQAVWKSGQAISVDLGAAASEDTFNLHLTAMPGYTNYQNNSNYSGVAVADMIIDYLVPDNSDGQPALMSLADTNGDTIISSSELERLLNQKVGHGYYFGSTATIGRYSNWGIIDQFDAASQPDCIKQICHWLAYKVPNVPAGREYVPVAIATSANPAIAADSDYRHWMSVVGIKTNQDPFPNLSANASFREEYRAPSSLALYGVYLNDPGQSGLGFHTYMSADVWATQYFRPIAAGLEGAGLYAAIMEPPDPKAVPIKVTAAQNNHNLQVVLEIPEKGISVFIPKSLDKNVKDYLTSLLKQLKKSPDFTTLIEDSYFGEAIKNTQVKRCFKVSGKSNQDYTIVPFEKVVSYEILRLAQDERPAKPVKTIPASQLITTLAIIVNNETGQFQIASADNKASDIYNPMPWYEAYMALRKKIGWNEHLVKYWLSNASGSALFPGYSVVTAKSKQQGPVQILNTNEYAVPAEGKVTLEQTSPEVEILSAKIIRSNKEWVKLVSFRVSSAEEYTVEVQKKNQRGNVSLLRNQDKWLVALRGTRNASCTIEIKSASPTYIYIRQ